MISFEINEYDKAGVLTLEGEMSIDQAEELKAALISALDSTDLVMVDVEKVTVVELPCFELLCSAHRTALNMGKDLEYSAAPPDRFAQAVRDSGYARSKGCSPESQDRCLWLQKQEP